MHKTIQIDEELRKRLRTVGKKDETYADIINRALDCLETSAPEDRNKLQELRHKIKSIEDRLNMFDIDLQSAMGLAEQARDTVRKIEPVVNQLKPIGTVATGGVDKQAKDSKETTVEDKEE